MANKAKSKSTRGRKQDRALVAGRQDYEVGYESKKSGKSRSAVKKAVKKVGSSRKAQLVAALAREPITGSERGHRIIPAGRAFDHVRPRIARTMKMRMTAPMNPAIR
jgi:hypothetical protein